MSTGSSRWSSSRSPSAGAGPGTASAIPGAMRSSASGRASRPGDWPDDDRRGRRLAPPPARRPRRGPRRRWPSIARRIPGHWIVTFPWRGAERARTSTEAALALAERDVSPSRTAHLTGAQERLAGALDRARSPPRGPRRRPGSATPTGASRSSRSPGRTARARSPGSSPTSCAAPAGTSARRRRTACSSTSGWSSPATGPGRAARSRSSAGSDIDVAVLETARGGIVLRGMGYESNDASVLTNVSSDHLDLQGIHTLPELAEVKSTVCRITKPDGWVVLNADDPLRGGRRPAGPRPASRYFSLADGGSGRRPPPSRERGGRAYLVRARLRWSRPTATRDADIVEVGRDPDHDRRAGAPQRRQRAGRGRRRARPGRHDRAGPRRADRLPAVGRAVARAAQPVPARGPGRHRRLRPQRGGHLGGPRRRRGDRRRRGRPGRADHRDHRDRRRPAGRHAPRDRPDRRASAPSGSRSSRRSRYLRGRTAESVVGELLAGVKAGGGDADDGPDLRRRRRRRCGPSSTARPGTARTAARADAARVIVLMCHEDRDGVFELLLERSGARPVDVASELTELVPAGCRAARAAVRRDGAAGPTSGTSRPAAATRRGRPAAAEKRRCGGSSGSTSPWARGHRLALDPGRGRLERPRPVPDLGPHDPPSLVHGEQPPAIGQERLERAGRRELDRPGRPIAGLEPRRRRRDRRSRTER